MQPDPETNRRILQEVSCARRREDVTDILRDYYHYLTGLPPRAREKLNAEIQDILAEIPK